jgi:hypothetical protein
MRAESVIKEFEKKENCNRLVAILHSIRLAVIRNDMELLESLRRKKRQALGGPAKSPTWEMG